MSSKVDYDMLEELRRWMISAEVTKVTVHGITLELGETAFWGNESDSKANRDPKSPPDAPWDTLDEHETPQQRIRREHEAALGRPEPKDSVS